MFIIVFLASAVLVALVRHDLLKRRILDIPNGRSSHSVPVPRGGGASIVIVFLIAILFLVQKGSIPRSLGWALLGGGLAVALAGFVDDRFRLSAGVRLLIQFAAAAWALWQLNGFGPMQLGSFVWDWGWVGQLLALLGLVWMINLYNFMDGIDGLAGLEAVFASGLGGLLLLWCGLGGLAESALMLTAASAGFLVWNWPPAKIFMGDVGSGFLGFVFGILIISSAKERPWLLWPWLILLSVFIVDSTLTLIRRLISGGRWNEAHCTHAYQHAARKWSSHSKVTLMIGAVNTAWLFPLGFGACIWPDLGPIFVVIALAPLIYAAFRHDAGLAPDTRGLHDPKLKSV